MVIVYFVLCFCGLEQVLVDELVEIVICFEVDELVVFEVGCIVLGGVYFFGMQGVVYVVNLYSCIVSCVLMWFGLCGYCLEDDIYVLVVVQCWEDYFMFDEMICVDVIVYKLLLQSLKFVGLCVKDGVCDCFCQCMGVCLSVDMVLFDVCIYVYLIEIDCMIYFDIIGELLFKCGWWQEKGEVLLKENFVVGILCLMGWMGVYGMLFYDLMCGSGMFFVEVVQCVFGIVFGG